MHKYGFIQLQRQAEELFESDIDAYVIMCQIMFRARRTISKYDRYGLKVGQALIGDYKSLGLTEKRYRLAKDRIQNQYKLATFKGTNKGTIATLINTEFCNINPEGEVTSEKITSLEEHQVEQKEEKKGEQRANGTTGKPTPYNHNSEIRADEGRTEGELRATNKECNNIIKQEEIITTTPLPPKDDVVIPLFKNGGGSKDYSHGDIVLRNPKGKEVSISENEIYQHFLRSKYSTEILKKAIQEARNTQTPVSDILRYIEAICERLQKKQDLIPSDKKPKNEPPKCTDQGVYGGKYFNF